MKLGQFQRARSVASHGAELQALVSFGFAQGVGMLFSILRVPIAIGGLGVGKFGILSLVVASVPWFSLLPLATRASFRILAAEGRGADYWTSSTFLRTISLTRRCGLILGAASCALLVGHMCGGVLAGGLWGGLAFTGLVCSTQGVGSAALGALEARGRVQLVNMLTAGCSIGGFLIVLASHLIGDNFYLYSLGFLLPMVGPAWCARMLPGRLRPLDTHESPDLELAQSGGSLIRRMTRLLGVQQLQNGVDPFIIAWAISAVAVSQYSVVTRISAVLTMLPTAIQPVVVRRFASMRSECGEDEIRRLQVRYSMVLAGGASVLGLGVICFGSQLVALLTGRALHVPLALLVCVVGQTVLFAWQVPVFAALGGPSGTSLLARAMPFVAGTNLIISVVWVRFGVWGPTAASVVVAAGFHGFLFIKARRVETLYGGVHYASELPSR